jgi:(S)-mandelate dehydrogenase
MQKRKYYGGRNFRQAINIEELRQIVHRSVPRFALEYLEGGADDEVTLRRNRSVFEEITFVPRTLVDVGTRDLSTELFGQRIGMPMVIAPTALNGMLRHRADFSLAKAAAGAQIPHTLGTLATAKIEDLVIECGGNVWFQIYNMREREFWKRLVRRAEKAGCQALVITSDVPVYGNREWDARNYLAPAQLKFRSKLDVLRHPRWLMDVMLLHGQPRFENLTEILPDGDTRAINGAKFVTQQLDPTLNWNDVRMLRDLWPRPLLVKGIMTAGDAQKALELGADGIVITNHGGRQLDGAVSAMDVLPEIAAAVGREMTILVDGGFRRGTDIAKAVALGADAVMLGRATLYGVAAGGEAGAAHALAILKKEFDRTLALLGCTKVDQLCPELVRTAGFSRS